MRGTTLDSADGWIVVDKNGVVYYETFARTRQEAKDQHVESQKLWSWDSRNEGDRAVKATLCKAARP
jgi:hypothetical protein